MKTYTFNLGAQRADFSDAHFTSVMYGGPETRVASEQFVGSWPAAQARLLAFAAEQVKPCYCTITLANRNERAPAGYKDFRGAYQRADGSAVTRA